MRKSVFSWTAIIIFLVQGLCHSQGTDLPRFHAEDDSEWAKRSGLSIAEIRSLRGLVGLSDSSTGFIDNVDATTLAPYRIVLFATYEGSARCVIVWLFSKTDGGFMKLWSSPDAGGDLSFCADPDCRTPLATAKPNRDVAIEIPSKHGSRCIADYAALFKWTGQPIPTKES
ncbi:MAG: hypothetical protein WBC78_04945 [Candidatus Sulfotelmatobacter sp.]